MSQNNPCVLLPGSCIVSPKVKKRAFVASTTSVVIEREVWQLTDSGYEGWTIPLILAKPLNKVACLCVCASGQGWLHVSWSFLWWGSSVVSRMDGDAVIQLFVSFLLFPDLTQWNPWPAVCSVPFICTMKSHTAASLRPHIYCNPSHSLSAPSHLQYLVLHLFTPFTPSSHSASEVFFGRTDGRIGGSYQKVIYKEYTDNTFTTIKPPTPDSEHLGILGKASFFLPTSWLDRNRILPLLCLIYWYTGVLSFT